MTARRYNGSSYTDLSHFRRWSGSAWVDATFARRWDGSQWVAFWPTYTPISVSISPSSYNNNVSSNSGPVSTGFNAVVTGGNGSPTYSWTLTGVNPAGTVSITAGASTGTVTVQFDNGTDIERSATLNLAVDDGTSNDSTSIPITVIYGTPE